MNNELAQQASVVPTVVNEHTQEREEKSLLNRHTAHMQEREESTAAHRQGRRRERAPGSGVKWAGFSPERVASEVPWTLTQAVRIGWGQETGVG